MPGPRAEIAKLDKEVLGTEGRLIGRVTELLREVSARRGRVLSRDFARTLAEAKWQSIVLGTIGVLIGIFAALFVVRRTVRPLAVDRNLDPRAGRRREGCLDSRLTDVDNEIGDIARAAEVFRRTLVEADTAREAAVRALAEQRLAEESYRKLFEGSVDGIYVTTPAGALLNANPALARMMGYDTPEQLISGIGDIAPDVYVHPEARAEYQRLMQRDGMVREFEYQVRQRAGDDSLALRQRHRGARRSTAISSAMKARCATSPTRSAPRTRSPKAGGCCSRSSTPCPR